MINKVAYIIILIFLLSSCGSDGPKNRVMEKGEFYSVSKGDVIIKKSEDALIKIHHVSGKKTSTVSILDGNATITHPKEKKEK